MKTHLDIKHTGTLGDENRHRMSFDEDSVTQLMGVLTDLYSDKEAAVVREYITNAIDSHRAAGITDPVEVILPTALNPTFVVRDHGVGMSVEQVIRCYNYGYSSKRDSDEQVGMLGLGCKSALTYTSQFTVTAWQGGREAVILVTRDADGCGVVQVISESDTDKPNGVEVSIPVKDRYTFTRKVQNFAYYCDPGVLLVDGAQLPSVWVPGSDGEDDNRRVLDEDVIILPNSNQDYIVMGNVAYPVTGEDWAILREDYYTRSGVVARVPIGSVNFTPSREALHYTKRTKEALATLKEFVHGRLLKVAQDDVAAATDANDALRRATGWHPTLRSLDPNTYGRHGRSRNASSSPFKWDGHVVPLTREHVFGVYEYDDEGNRVHDPKRVRMWQWASYSDVRSSYDCEIDRIPVNLGDRNYISSRDSVVLVTGFTGETITRNIKRKCQRWCEINLGKDKYGHVDNRIFYFYNRVGLPLIWWEGVRTITFADLQKIELIEKPKRKKSDPPVYRFITHPALTYTERELTDEEKKGRILISTTQDPMSLSDNMGTVFQLYGPKKNIPIVRITLPQLDKFRALYPQAELLVEAIVKDAQAFEASLTTAEWVTYFSHSDAFIRRLVHLNPDKVLDPRLAQAVRDYRKVRENITYLIDRWDSLLKAVRAKRFGADRSTRNLDKTLHFLESEYPLVDSFDKNRLRYRNDGTLNKSTRPYETIILEYVNGVYLIHQQEKAAFKARMAALGRSGRRRKIRLRQSAKRRAVALAIKKQHKRRLKDCRAIVARMNDQREADRYYQAQLAAQKARKEAKQKVALQTQIATLVHQHQQVAVQGMVGALNAFVDALNSNPNP